jgi:hypothetical protein
MTGKTRILVVEDQTSVAMVLRRMRVADGLERRKSHEADPARLDMPIFIAHFNWHLCGNIRLERGHYKFTKKFLPISREGKKWNCGWKRFKPSKINVKFRAQQTMQEGENL